MKGALYNWFAVTNAREIAAPDWHVPTTAECWALMRYLDPVGGSFTNTAGGQMKEAGFTNWNAPNTDAVNSSGFTAQATGQRNNSGLFENLMSGIYLWNADEYSATEGNFSYIDYEYGTFYTSQPGTFYTPWHKTRGMALRLIKDSTLLLDGETGTYIGNDKKIYNTICIGTQEWMAENLCETEYRDSYPIAEVTGVTYWSGMTSGAMCWYNNVNECTNTSLISLIGKFRININYCTEGVYLRWWFNGWHYFNFQNGYDVSATTEHMGIQVTNYYSIISKVERPTRIKNQFDYSVTIEGLKIEDLPGFTGMLLSERVEQYEDLVWREVDLTRGDHLIKESGTNGYVLTFQITRLELPVYSSVYQKSLKLYLGDMLCDMDDDEVIPINKQVNDIAEMQDRQSDFTAQFKIRKTRAMRGLFELSGEVGIDTDFPYENQACKLIQDNIEVITNGRLVMDMVDDQYYYVSILSGNLNFFKLIEGLKITDLTLATANHTWNVAGMVGSHAADLSYVYPLCEPSDDAGICPLSDDGDGVDLYGGWIWPFIKVKTIWDEIFSNAHFTCEGDILTNDTFGKLYIPITSRTVTKQQADKYLYSVYWGGTHEMGVDNELLAFDDAQTTNGDEVFRTGYYVCPYTATYRFRVSVVAGTLLSPAPTLYLTKWWNTLVGTFNVVFTYPMTWEFEVEYDATAGDILYVVTTPIFYYAYSVRVIEITNPMIDYGSVVTAANHLPAMTQIDFIKMICNMFGLIPDVTPRDRTIKFWNYYDLYDNIPLARDWSAYLSERDDEVEFKYGDYAQDNYLRYADSDDVVKDTGRGSMQIADETLPKEKDVIDLPVSTCDEVTILANIFSVEVSRIAFNIFDPDTSLYDAEKTIDPRIVYINYTDYVGSPLYEKTMGLRPTVAPGGETDIDSPKKASSIEVSFSNLIYNYSSLSRLLTKTNLRRAKFNLPAFEVSGLKHNIPIYVSQYKAYFYVNKISNYVAGQLCTIDLIKL